MDWLYILVLAGAFYWGWIITGLILHITAAMKSITKHLNEEK